MTKKLLFFKQPDCTPCGMVDIFITQGLEITPDKTVMLFTGDKEADELALRFGIMTTPVLLLTDETETEEIQIARGIGKREIESIVANWLDK